MALIEYVGHPTSYVTGFYTGLVTPAASYVDEDGTVTEVAGTTVEVPDEDVEAFTASGAWRLQGAEPPVVPPVEPEQPAPPVARGKGRNSAPEPVEPPVEPPVAPDVTPEPEGEPTPETAA